MSERPWRMLIGGELVDGADHQEVLNPATEEILATAPVADEAQLDQAVRAAVDAFPAWRDLSFEERGAYLERIADAIEERAEEITLVVTLEQGKTLEASRADVESSVTWTRHFAGLRPEPQIVRDDDEARIEVHHKPLGVVGAILPWNFPFFQAVYKLAPALMIGNTVVMKPAPTTPLNTMLLGELLQPILPAGVVNVVGDEGGLGAALTAHPDIAKISFTGSTATGKRVMASSADSLKRLTLELGGNDAAIVLDDVDVPAAARDLFQWAFLNSGQVCINVKRIFAGDGIYDEFCEEFAKLGREAKVGPGSDPDTVIGPIQNARQFERVKGYLEIAKRDGNVIAGGDVVDGPGFFVEPTVVRDIDDDSELVNQETFGPIRSILKFDDVEDAVARANASSYGLGGSVWSGDVDRATEIAGRLDSGTVWVNQHFALSPDVPFGGRKESGMGVEWGVEGMNEFTDVQVVNISKKPLGS
ncbi:MAG: aldehyde dehydrogenase family protein [Solirubrobacterales bacterium]